MRAWRRRPAGGERASATVRGAGAGFLASHHERWKVMISRTSRATATAWRTREAELPGRARGSPADSRRADGVGETPLAAGES